MGFPIAVTANIQRGNSSLQRNFVLNSGLTVLLGPNGSGKTHILRALKTSLGQYADDKHIRFLSAGRMGLSELFRSDYNGDRGGIPPYDDATYGRKTDADRQHRMETINGCFYTLAERADIQIKIQERLRKLFKRELLVEWDGGELKISFARLEGESLPYSSGREASGLMHLVGILAALYDDRVGVLLIDEPEVSLHPQLQAFLLKEFISIAGLPSKGSNKKLIVIATHSTEMVQLQRPEDLASLVFCYDLDTNPTQISVNAGELQNSKVRGLIARLGQEHKLALFSKRPLLVEGSSDVIICNALSAKFDVHLEAAGSQVLPVIGKGEMPIVAKLLRLLGKEPVLLADADGMADGIDLVNHIVINNEAANSIASHSGFSSASEMGARIFNDFCALVDGRWDEIAHKAETHAYWINKKSVEETQARRRSALCTLLSLDENELKEISQDKSWERITQRLKALLNLLEQAGLFILRKGSIESYYQATDPLISVGKPSAAADEMDYILKGDRQVIEEKYSDILRCIRFASATEEIREVEALRDLLLAVVAPAQARLKSTNNQLDFNILARSLVGERSKLFEISVEQESLVISLSSTILSIPGFSLVIDREDDVLRKVNAALQSRS